MRQFRLRATPLKRLMESSIIESASKARVLLMENAIRGFWVCNGEGVAPWGGRWGSRPPKRPPSAVAKLGGDRGALLTAKQRAAGRAVLMARARKRAPRPCTNHRRAPCGRMWVTAGHRSGPRSARHPRSKGGKVERHTGDAAVGGSRRPLRRASWR